MPVANPNPFTRGDIFVSTWGRDQDIIDFYQVVRATPKTVVVRRIESRIIKIVGPTRAVIVPMLDSFRSEEQRRRIVYDGRGPYMRLSGWEWALLWDGVALLTTRYA